MTVTIHTLSEKSIRELAADHYKLRRLVEAQLQRLTNLVAAEEPGEGFFRNESGEEVPAFGVMRITGYERTTGVYIIGKPNTTFHRECLINGSKKVSTGAGGHFFRARSCQVLYDNANTPAFGETWGPTNDSWKIIKDMYGFTILGDNVTDGESIRTLVQQEPVQYVFGKADAEMTALGGSGTVSVWKGKFASDSGVNITATNETGLVIESGKRCRVNTMAGRDIAEPFECPTP